MPTEIANAVGTARQFTPQPDAVYQGRYREVGVSQVGVSRTNTEMLADNMSKLNEAFLGYALNHEKYLSAKGENDAANMIKGMSAEDIEKLNVIDAAQMSGFADAAANPYFRAYAEKLRGNFLSARMKQDYDAEYAMSPAKSADEELKRYKEYADSWKKTHLKNIEPDNQIAFDKGFNENHVINMGQLGQAWTKRRNEENVTVAIAQMNSELGDIIKNSAELLKTNGAMTQAVQKVFNEGRLMALPPNIRQKLLSDFSEQLVKTGHLDEERFNQMMDNIVVQTSITGETTKASDLLNMMDFRTFATQFHSQFLTQEKADWVDAYSKQGDEGLKKARAEVAAMLLTNPEKAVEYNKLIPQIHSEVERAKAKAERERLARMRASSGGNGSTLNEQGTKALVNAWLRGDTHMNGRPLTSFKVDEGLLSAELMNDMQFSIDNKDYDSVLKMLQLPQAGQVRKSISAQLNSQLSLIRPTDDGGVNLGANESFKHLAEFMAYNADAMEGLLDGDIARTGHIIKNYISTYNGDVEQGLRAFANYNSLDSDMKASFKTAVNSIINANYTIEGAQHLGDNTKDTFGFWGNTNTFARKSLEMLAISNMALGLDEYDAVNKAGAVLKEQYTTYHKGAFPKGVYSNLRTGNDDVYFKKALDIGIYSAAASKEETASDVLVNYNDKMQMFTFNNPTTGEYYEMSLSTARLAAQEAYERDIAERTNTSVPDNTTMSVDTINENRAPQAAVSLENVPYTGNPYEHDEPDENSSWQPE